MIKVPVKAVEQGKGAAAHDTVFSFHDNSASGGHRGFTSLSEHTYIQTSPAGSVAKLACTTTVVGIPTSSRSTAVYR
jgi:hypothetical protein